MRHALCFLFFWKSRGIVCRGLRRLSVAMIRLKVRLKSKGKDDVITFLPIDCVRSEIDRKLTGKNLQLGEKILMTIHGRRNTFFSPSRLVYSVMAGAHLMQ